MLHTAKESDVIAMAPQQRCVVSPVQDEQVAVWRAALVALVPKRQGAQTIDTNPGHPQTIKHPPANILH
jgi:hypothetical protein